MAHITGMSLKALLLIRWSLYNLYLGPRLVIILDNALVYYINRQNIKDVYRRHSVLVRFLLLYSPDFNLIKESFIDLKIWI
jgi:transposase